MPDMSRTNLKMNWARPWTQFNNVIQASDSAIRNMRRNGSAAPHNN